MTPPNNTVAGLPAKWREMADMEINMTNMTPEVIARINAERATYRQCARSLEAALASPAPSAPVVVEDTRVKFERWVSKRHGGGTERWADTGKYRYDSTNAWWECWQEAQKVATPPASMNIAHRSVPETSGE